MATREHRGWTLAALGIVGVVTAAWWVLALYPVASAPEWILRTRYACFGAAPGALPNAGGWILLVGQPAGMLALLFTGWGDAVRRDLSWLSARAPGRLTLGAAVGALAWGVLSVVGIVRKATETGDRFSLRDPVVRARSIDVPALRLIDQHGRTFDLASLDTVPVLVSFAFAHCETMCPIAIRELLRIRGESGREDIPLVVVTVDPWRDVPSRLSAIAATWKLASGDHVLGGAVDDVNQVLDDWAVARVRDANTGDVVHPLAAVLVHPGGKRGTRIDGGFEGLRAILSQGGAMAWTGS